MSVNDPDAAHKAASMKRVHADLFLISTAARLLEMHPQTLRKYERLGLVRPVRTLGSMRVYTREEIDRLRLIKQFVDEGGINLAGVQRLLEVAALAQRLHPLVRERRAARRSDLHRRLSDELDELFRLVGLERPR
jgi:MerR family transcriptional regulator/heat shock protein HspR